MGFYWGMCFTRQNFSLTLNHVKHFPLFCHCYFIIFNYDLYYLLKPVKICFFWKKCHCIWSDIGPDMCLDLLPILAIQWWLQACSVLLFEFQKVALKRILGTFFFKFSPNLFRKAVYKDKGWAVTFSWYLPMSLSDFTPALVWWVDYTMKANGETRENWVVKVNKYGNKGSPLWRNM